MKSMLKVDNINVFYGELQALREVSFNVEQGEIVAIIGSNGAGKSTILKAVSGLLKPKTGSINFLGNEISKLDTNKIVDLGICQVPEGRQLFALLTVLENLKLGAYGKMAKGKYKDSLEWVYQIFPRLKEREKQKAGTLSGGEQQMLAIGRALMSRPKLLMLDEPSLGLAPNLVLSVFQVCERLHCEECTILLVEQNTQHALKLADRGYVLETGRVTLEGEGKDLLKNDYLRKAYLGL